MKHIDYQEARATLAVLIEEECARMQHSALPETQNYHNGRCSAFCAAQKIITAAYNGDPIPEPSEFLKY